MKRPIYQIILRQYQSGKLDESYRLPGQEKIIPGSMDARKIVFNADAPYASTEDVRRLTMSIRLFADGDYEQGKTVIEQLLNEKPFIQMIDQCELYLHRFYSVLNTEKLLGGMLILLNETTEPEVIKYALFILNLIPGYDAKEDLTKQVYCLGLYEEFTFYAVLLLQVWNRDLLWQLVQNVHGWGRIIGVLYLRVENRNQQDWILQEGTRNNVDESLSVLPCYKLAKVHQLLQGNVTEREFVAIAHLFDLMVDPDSAIKPETVFNFEDDMCLFLEQTEVHDPDIETYNDIGGMFLFAHAYQLEKVEDSASKIIFSKECASVVQKSLFHGEGMMLAEIIGIPWQDVTYHYLETDFSARNEVLRYLVSDDKSVDQALILAEQNIDLEKIGEEPEDTIAAINVLYGLMDQPGKGREFVIAALQSKAVDMHYEAMYVLQRWSYLTDQPLREIDPELVQMVRENKDNDPDAVELRNLLISEKKEEP